MELATAHCRGVTEADRLETGQAEGEYLGLLHAEWAIEPQSQTLYRVFNFNGYSEVMIFANFVAWLANRENHHPVMTLEYKRCKLEFTTHSAHGLSLNDFICAAKIDHYLEPTA